MEPNGVRLITEIYDMGPYANSLSGMAVYLQDDGRKVLLT